MLYGYFTLVWYIFLVAGLIKSSFFQVYASFFKEPYPARAAYECANLPKYGLVEIEAVAVVGELEDK